MECSTIYLYTGNSNIDVNIIVSKRKKVKRHMKHGKNEKYTNMFTFNPIYYTITMKSNNSNKR